MESKRKGKKKKETTSQRGRCAKAGTPHFPTSRPVSLLPSFCSGPTVSATISVGSQPSLSLNTYVFCLSDF